MVQKVHLSENVYWVGVNDRHTQLFENYWPLPYGVSYNAYLIDDERVALIDTVEIGFMEEYIRKIKDVLGDRKVDYLVVNHMEPDHSGSIKTLLREYPEMKVVGNAKTIPILEGFYDVLQNHIIVKEGDTLPLGKHTLQFFPIPMVHWPESMTTYETSENILFSNDAFGSFGALNGGIFDNEINFSFYEDEMRRYYANIVGKYGVPVQKALEKLGGLTLKTIAPSHGPIWREMIPQALDYYDKWSKCEGEEGVVVVYGTLYGHTAQMADMVARSIAEEGIRNIKVHNSSVVHPSYILSDIWKYKGVVLGSSSYNGGIFTPMDCLIKKLLQVRPKNRLLGVFGSLSWSGGAGGSLDLFSQEIKWELVSPLIEIKHAATKDEDIRKLVEIGKAMAKALKQ